MKIKLLIFIIVLFPLIALGEGLTKIDVEQKLKTINDPVILDKIGRQLYKKKAYYTAIKYFKKVITLKPELKSAYYNLGLSYVKINQPEKAILAFQQVLQRDPDHEKANKLIDKILPKFIRIPIIYYDWKCDLSNPDFNVDSDIDINEATVFEITSKEITTANWKKYKITENTEMFSWKNPLKRREHTMH